MRREDEAMLRLFLLETDILPTILGFLGWKDILLARVCRKWREAVRLTDVPPSNFEVRGMQIPELYVRNRDIACALGWISNALPRISSINFNFSLGPTEEFDIADGEGPKPTLVFNREQFNLPPLPPPVDISPIANFRDFRHLNMYGTGLNGSYPYLFDFPNLRTLDLSDNGRLKWDLDLLSGLPKLVKLRCIRNYSATGNLKSIRHLLPKLVELCLVSCEQIEGSLMDVSDFPCLEELNLGGTKVTGDIREIGATDFVSLKDLEVGDGVYGGGDLPSIQDAPAIMLARYYLKKRNPFLFQNRRWHLPHDSSERYEINDHHSRQGPFFVEFVKAGCRLGWRWTNCVSGGSCETHWLDTEPDPSNEGYHAYIEELKWVENDVEFYRGFLVPPTEEEHCQRSREVPLDPILARYSSPSCFGVW